MPEVTIRKEDYRVMLQDDEVPQFLLDKGFTFNTSDIKRTEEFGNVTFKQSEVK